MALKSGGVACKSGSCVAGGGGYILPSTPNPPPRAAERSEQSAALIPYFNTNMECEIMDKEFFEQFSLEQILAISEIVEAMLSSQQASPDFQE